MIPTDLRRLFILLMILTTLGPTIIWVWVLLTIGNTAALNPWMLMPIVLPGPFCALLAVHALQSYKQDDPPSPAPTDSNQHQRLIALAGGLAHELGQPLSVARVSVEGLHFLRQIGKEPSAEHVEQTLNQIGRSVLTMTSIIEHLQMLAARSRDIRVEPIHMNAFMTTLLSEREMWLRFAETRIEWHPHNSDAYCLHADPNGLRLILVNVIKNAVEATVHLPETERVITIRLDEQLGITVHNFGAPIDSEQLAHIFDPFYSSKRSSHISQAGQPPVRGIGLCLAHASAEHMGAELTVSSDETGTVFTIHLPQTPTAAPNYDT